MFENLPDEQHCEESLCMVLEDLTQEGYYIYGKYHPSSKTFYCTYGAWEEKIEFIDDNTLILFDGVKGYKFIDHIPADYYRV